MGEEWVLWEHIPDKPHPAKPENGWKLFIQTAYIY